MSDLRKKRICRALLVCLAGGLAVGVAIWLLPTARQQGGNDADTGRTSARALDRSKVGRAEIITPAKRRDLSAGRKPRRELLALNMVGKMQVSVAEDDVGEGEVLTLPVLKESMEEREVRSALVPARDKDERSFLAAMRTMMRSEDPAARVNVLKTIGILYSGESAPAEPEEGDEAALSAEAKRIRGLVSVIREGLYDANADVRATAVKTSRRVEGDVSGVIVSQVMSGDDPELKLLFLEETAGKATEADMTVSLMGFAAQEQAVRDAAAANLRGLTGVDFASYEDAAAWWEANHIDFLGRAAGIPADSDVSVAIGPAGEDADTDADMQNLLPTDKNKQTNNERKQ